MSVYLRVCMNNFRLASIHMEYFGLIRNFSSLQAARSIQDRCNFYKTTNNKVIITETMISMCMCSQKSGL